VVFEQCEPTAYYLGGSQKSVPHHSYNEVGAFMPKSDGKNFIMFLQSRKKKEAHLPLDFLSKNFSITVYDKIIACFPDSNRDRLFNTAFIVGASHPTKPLLLCDSPLFN
jgi:hypothetical protein